MQFSLQVASDPLANIRHAVFFHQENPDSEIGLRLLGNGGRFWLS